MRAASIGNDQALHALAHGFQAGAYQVTLFLVVFAAMAAWIMRRWWTVGRDHWYGDSSAGRGTEPEETKPLLAHETIVVTYKPPTVPSSGRPLRPAEIGLLLREGVDNVDVSATIVDLAVRKHLEIRELPRPPLLKRRDYELIRLAEPDEELLPYERTLMNALFDGRTSVRLSDLRGQFSQHFAAVKYEVHDPGVRDSLFQSSPDDVRENYRLLGVLISAGGLIATAVLTGFGAGLIALPVVSGGVLLLAIAIIMPRRTALGHQVYRLCLGFREYVATAEIDRERFAEEQDLFDNYLPYAMIFGCTSRWARAFHELESWDSFANWYWGTSGLLPLDIAIGVGELVAGLAEARR